MKSSSLVSILWIHLGAKVNDLRGLIDTPDVVASPLFKKPKLCFMISIVNIRQKLVCQYIGDISELCQTFKMEPFFENS